MKIRKKANAIREFIVYIDLSNDIYFFFCACCMFSKVRE